jgi:hypothetical protein
LRFATLGVALMSALSILPQATRAEAPPASLITDEIIQNIKAFIDTDIVRMSIISQNEKYGDLTQEKIDALDAQWAAERKAEDRSLIAATLSNPLSTYLTRVQAQSYGLYTEIFVMDKNGLNVGQSNITSDYWQGDEAKHQKTFPVSGTAIFIDEPEYDKDSMSWNVQVNLSITDGKNPDAIGAATVEINLTELERRNKVKAATTQ